MLPLLPYFGIASAVVTVLLWVRDRLNNTHSTVAKIASNDLPHIEAAINKQTEMLHGELKEMRADFRTYFAPQPGAAPVSVTVNPVITNEQNKSRDLAVSA
jgi:hypothetical protein